MTYQNLHIRHFSEPGASLTDSLNGRGPVLSQYGDFGNAAGTLHEHS
ncbi:hypothetical protein [Serratia grimesii]